MYFLAYIHFGKKIAKLSRQIYYYTESTLDNKSFADVICSSQDFFFQTFNFW